MTEFYFNVHPSVVFKLGAELVTDHVQALVELIKNSYEADATYANVVIDTHGGADLEDSAFPDANGYIMVEDNGHGMDESDLVRGWFTISNSAKSDMKKRGEATPGGRTPLGDKGLGRLGAQRLGDNLEIFTQPREGNVGYHVAFSWPEFLKYRSLSEVPVRVFEPRPATEPKARTKIIVSELRDPDLWRGRAFADLLTRLSLLVSPYELGLNFRVTGRVDGKPLELTRIAQGVLDSSQISYEIEFDGSEIVITGRARLIFFAPESEREADQFKELVEEDEGEAFCRFLTDKRQANSFELRKSSKPGWFIEFGRRRRLDELDKAETADGHIANPGPFKGRVDSFGLGRKTKQEQSVFDKFSDFKEYVKTHRGIAVYRDGFGIRVPRDWLRLGSGWTSAKSYYSLKPDNTMGYIALTAKDNGVLRETTDREGFLETPHYNNFVLLLNEFVRFSSDAQGFVRRTWVEFRKSSIEKTTQPDKPLSAEALTELIKQTISEPEKRQPRPPNEAGDDKVVARKLQQAMSALEEIASLEPKLELLKHQIAELREQAALAREQAALAVEVMSLGLTAEALSHEIQNIADQLADRTRSIEKYISRRNIGSVQLSTYLEYVKSSVSTLRKQLSHLAPSLRYVREKKNTFRLGESFLDQADVFSRRFARSHVNTSIIDRSNSPFVVSMNLGKLVQIMDNLLLNSEYWLGEEHRLGILPQGEITIELARPRLRIWDNGRGIDPVVEDSLFQPFITMKARGEGRGLGLFIVRQLLDSESCFIELLPERNEHGRMFKFEIDFTGVLAEHE